MPANMCMRIDHLVPEKCRYAEAQSGVEFAEEQPRSGGKKGAAFCAENSERIEVPISMRTKHVDRWSALRSANTRRTTCGRSYALEINLHETSKHRSGVLKIAENSIE